MVCDTLVYFQFNVSCLVLLWDRRMLNEQNWFFECAAVKKWMRHDRILICMHKLTHWLRAKTLFTKHAPKREREPKKTFQPMRCYRGCDISFAYFHIGCLWIHFFFSRSFHFFMRLLFTFRCDAAISWGSFVRSIRLYSNRMYLYWRVYLFHSTRNSNGPFPKSGCNRDKHGIPKSKNIRTFQTKYTESKHSPTENFRVEECSSRLVMQNSMNRIIVK